MIVTHARPMMILHMVVMAVCLAVLSMVFVMPAQAQAGGDEAVAAISGSAWVDMNRNGIREMSEPVNAHSMVFLQETSDATSERHAPVVAMTDAQGNYLFLNLPAGTYNLWAGTDGRSQVLQVEIESGVQGMSSLNVSIAPYTVMLPLVMN